MQFFVVGHHSPTPDYKKYPFVELVNDNWNDYGFKTLFHPIVHLSQKRYVNLGNVKILKLDQEYGRTDVDDVFNRLDESYCSLGQELAYYESLMELPEKIRDDYLLAMRDAAANPEIRDDFRSLVGFRDSLLRWGTAARALEDARAILLGVDATDDELDFTFHTKLGSNEFSTEFRYCQIDGIPGRINALIGYNGTGKTQLLVNLAWVSRGDLTERDENESILKYGRITPKNIRFGRVITVSYSAFDTFDLPMPSNPNAHFGYTYCGLRQFDEDGDERYGLKAPEEIVEEVEAALERVNTTGRKESLSEALQPLRDEPSFKRAGYELDLLGRRSRWYQEFAQLSSGHKMAVNVIVQLVAFLQRGSLVLIDEPESHLHPPLLAALMKGVNIALEKHKSYAVIATHSPVVLQEVAGCYARVLRRHGTKNSVVEPSIETFGENLGLLTKHVFNLDNSRSDYVGILEKLAAEYSLEEIEELFEKGLSSQARALVMQAGLGR